MAVSAPVRAKGQTHCSYHREESYQLFCVTCQELACIKCVSTVHRQHEIDNLKDLTPLKKSTIQDFISASEDVKRDEFERNLTSVDQKLIDEEDKFNKVSAATKSQAAKLKQIIDEFTDKKISMYLEIKESNVKLLTKQKQDIYEKKQTFDDFLTKCKKTVQKGSDIQVHDVEKKVKVFPVRPSAPSTVQLVSFTPNLTPLSSIEHAFGAMTISTQDQCLPIDVNDLVNTDVSLTELSPIGEDAWACVAGCDETIALINRNGKVIRKNSFVDLVIGISVSPTSQHVWVQLNNEDVIEVTPSTSFRRFRHNSNSLHSICVTRDEHILLGQSGELAKLNTNGKVVLKTSKSKNGSPLCVSPNRISECQISGNIAMIDNDKHVLVINKAIRHAFTYTPESSTNRQTLPTDTRLVDVTYDKMGRLVVCDSQSIYILSSKGKFLMQFYQSEEQFQNLSCAQIDQTGTLWVLIGIKAIKLLRYF